MKRCNRTKLSMDIPRLAPLCFDRSIEIFSTESITLDELKQMYKRSVLETKKYSYTYLRKLQIKNFNELVHLHMNPENEQFISDISTKKLLQCLKGKIILDGKNENCSTLFFQKFLDLLAQVEGNILLVFVNIEPEIKNMDYALYLHTMLQKNGRGDTTDIIYLNANFNNKMPLDVAFSFSYGMNESNKMVGLCHVRISPRENSVAKTKQVIEMIDEDDSLLECKQHLVNKILPLVEKREIPESEEFLNCESCESFIFNDAFTLELWLEYPAHSNCANCMLK